MSRWISKHARYTLGVRGEVTQFRMLANGVSEPVKVAPELVVEFRPIANAVNRDADEGVVGANSRDIEVAHATWGKRLRRDGTPADLNALPAMNAGVIAGRAHVGFQIDSLWGIFDTAWLDNEDDAAAADAKLRANAANGNDYVEVTPKLVAPPWPNYDKVKVTGRSGSVAEQIAKKVAADGYDIEVVLEYERAHKNRQDVIDAVLAVADAPAEEAQSDDDMVQVI